MSDTESDESICTEDMNEINAIENQVYEEVPVKSVERTKRVAKRFVNKPPPPQEEVVEEPIKEVVEEPVKEEVKKPKRPQSEKQKENIKKLVERNKARALERKKAKEEGKIIDEKPLGRKPKPKPPAQEVIINREIQKIIYMVPDGQGGYEKHLNPPSKSFSKKDMEYHKNMLESEKEDIVKGRVLMKTKKGTVDKRSNQKTRTPAQIAATQKLVELSKKKAEDRKKNKKSEKDSMVETIKSEVHNSIVDVVTTKREDLKKKEIKRSPERQPKFTDRDRQLLQQRKVQELFS